MLNINDIMETVSMIQEENLDIRTITMGISLLDCADSDIDASCRKVYEKLTTKAGSLVKVGEEIENLYGIPIINKRISVTPIALISGGIRHPERLALSLDRFTAGERYLVTARAEFSDGAAASFACEIRNAAGETVASATLNAFRPDDLAGFMAGQRGAGNASENER